MAKDDAPQESSAIALGCHVLFLLILGAIALLIYQDPEVSRITSGSRVEVVVSNIPAGARFLCFVTEADGMIEMMNWSRDKPTPREVTPMACVMSYRAPDDGSTIANWHVIWRIGDRHGIATRRTDQTWQITWFGFDKLPWEGEPVAFDLSKGETEPFPPGELRRLGLYELHFEGEKP